MIPINLNFLCENSSMVLSFAEAKQTKFFPKFIILKL